MKSDQPWDANRFISKSAHPPSILDDGNSSCHQAVALRRIIKDLDHWNEIFNRSCKYSFPINRIVIPLCSWIPGHASARPPNPIALLVYDAFLLKAAVRCTSPTSPSLVYTFITSSSRIRRTSLDGACKLIKATPGLL